MAFSNYSIEDVTTNDSQVPFLLFQLSYGTPSLLLMFFFLVFLGCSQKFTNSFYRLVQLDLITNILCYSNNWIALRVRGSMFGVSMLKALETLLPGCLTWSAYLVRWFLHMQFWSAAALGTHRITSVLFPHQSEKFWARWYLLYGLAGCLYSTLPEFSYPGKTVIIAFNDGVLTTHVDVERGNWEVTMIAVFSTCYFVVLSGIGLTTVYQFNKNVQAFSSSHDIIKRKLTRVALTNTLLYLGILLWSVTSAINFKFKIFPKLNLSSSPILTVASDMVTLCLPYLLLTFDSNVRSDLVRRVRTALFAPKITPGLVSTTRI